MTINIFKYFNDKRVQSLESENLKLKTKLEEECKKSGGYLYETCQFGEKLAFTRLYACYDCSVKFEKFIRTYDDSNLSLDDRLASVIRLLQKKEEDL